MRNAAHPCRLNPRVGPRGFFESRSQTCSEERVTSTHSPLALLTLLFCQDAGAGGGGTLTMQYSFSCGNRRSRAAGDHVIRAPRDRSSEIQRVTDQQKRCVRRTGWHSRFVPDTPCNQCIIIGNKYVSIQRLPRRVPERQAAATRSRTPSTCHASHCGPTFRHRAEGRPTVCQLALRRVSDCDSHSICPAQSPLITVHGCITPPASSDGAICVLASR